MDGGCTGFPWTLTPISTGRAATSSALSSQAGRCAGALRAGQRARPVAALAHGTRWDPAVLQRGRRGLTLPGDGDACALYLGPVWTFF